MPLAGKGMLLTSMDVDAADEAEFNRWYDREHLEERVAIDGFLEARRYIVDEGSPKYLCLYSTTAIEVLDSPAYRNRLANPTEWSRKTMARFRNMIRAAPLWFPDQAERQRREHKRKLNADRQRRLRERRKRERLAASA